MRTTILRLTTLLALTILATGCRSAGVPSASLEDSRPVPHQAIRYVRDSAEYRTLLRQAYRHATRELESLAATREPGSWAVSLDADETLISNLGYSIRRARVGGTWTQESWNLWVEDREAPALPGAIEFVDTVRRLGGKVVVVTNRAEASCDATRDNLRAVGVRFDAVLCRPSGETHKDRRWEAIQAGEATGLEPLELVMWIGDNIFDFPGGRQDAAAAENGSLGEFGKSYVLLPNPLYGSWEE